ncbi:MAG: glycosyltransferase family 4 protein [Bacteroidales bacterium]|jgi:glycosyltransferase involved in cell wall biosynthesis|nr:glycosyltransferase family 4 protein [Bacteroidales bacterium]
MPAKSKILYIVPHRFNRSPGQRFRCEHFIPILQHEGYETRYAYLLSKWDDTYFYKKGAYFFKLLVFIKAFFRRMYHVCIAKQYNVIFIYREAFMIGTTLFERLLKRTGVPIIYDFDDSIWLNDTSEGNQNLAWLKKTSKTDTIISLANVVIVGNEFLAQHARQFNSNVFVIPTTIDTNYHKPNPAFQQKEHTICIGWTGSETTVKHFMLLENVLLKIKQKYGEQITFKLISNNLYENNALGVKTTFWNAQDEIAQLSHIDIGIMPLPNDEWSKGKCGFKGLQYMAMEIPCIMSAVGVNTEIIEHGVNGFLAHNDEEWEYYLTLLIKNGELRKVIGKRGRKTVEERYSIDSQKEKYVRIFNELNTISPVKY